MDRVKEREKETVILLHGIWTRGLEMALLKKRLQGAGFVARIYSYPTISKPLTENVDALAGFIQDNTCGTVSLVGHSYGGIVACSLVNRVLAGTIKGVRIKRCIFLGSPLLGSSIARRLERWAFFRFITGKSLDALKAGCNLSDRGQVESLMVAGTMNFGFGMFMIKGPGDGVVALSETMAPWLDAHHTVHVTHLGLLFSRKVARLCIDFLHSGPS